MVAGQVPVVVVLTVVLSQQRGYLVAQDSVQFTRRHIFVTSHTFLNALNNLQRRFNTDIRCYQHFLQVVKHIVVNLRFACYGTGQFVEHAGLGLLQTLIQRLLLFLIKKSEYSHT